MHTIRKLEAFIRAAIRLVLVFLFLFLRLVDVESDVAHVFLDGFDCFHLGRSVKVASRLPQQNLKVFCHIPPRDIHALDRVGKRETLIHWHRACHSVATVQNNTRRSPTCVERKNRFSL